MTFAAVSPWRWGILQVASYFGWPVSTTHCIIGAMVGFGLIYGGVGAVYWKSLFRVVSSWVVSPLLGALVSFLVYKCIRRVRAFTTVIFSATATSVSLIHLNRCNLVLSLWCYQPLKRISCSTHLCLALIPHKSPRGILHLPFHLQRWVTVVPSSFVMSYLFLIISLNGNCSEHILVTFVSLSTVLQIRDKLQPQQLQWQFSWA